MRAHVLNGIGNDVPNWQPTNVADLLEQAYFVIDGGLTGVQSLQYGQMVEAAHYIADHIANRFPGATMDYLAGVPCIGSIWEDLHKSTTNITREYDWLKDAQRINPMMVPIRAALIELTKGNVGGLADMFDKARPEVLKAQWEAHGGKWSDFQRAIAHGRGRKGDSLNGPPALNGPADDPEVWLDWAVNGRYRTNQGGTTVETWSLQGPDDVYYLPGGNPADTTYYQPGGNPNVTTTAPPPQATPPIQQGGGSSWRGLWDVAGPLINSLLGSAATAAGQQLSNAINPPKPQPVAPPAPPVRPPATSGRNVARTRMSPFLLAEIRRKNAEHAAKLRKQKQTNALLWSGAAAAALYFTGAFKR